MKEHPILFQPWKVRRILEWDWSLGDMQTRRVIKPPVTDGIWFEGESREWRGSPLSFQLQTWHSPYGMPGDRLWVRETFDIFTLEGENIPSLLYKADSTAVPIIGTGAWLLSLEHKWRPSIHMPRWASRLTLEVVGVYVQRVQQMTVIDCSAEGVVPATLPAFEELWNTINAKRGFGWDVNPWVWVVTFRLAPPEPHPNPSPNIQKNTGVFGEGAVASPIDESSLN